MIKTALSKRRLKVIYYLEKKGDPLAALLLAFPDYITHGLHHTHL